MVGNSSVRYSTVRYVADRCHFTLHASSPSEHKIGIFVRFWRLEPLFSGFLQITEHTSKMQIPHTQIINF